MAFPVVQEVNELFRATDAAATAALLAKLAVEKSYSSKLDETRAAIQALSLSTGCHKRQRHCHLVCVTAGQDCGLLAKRHC